MKLTTAVIIPCYNDGATVTAAVESVQCQGSPEIIIVDDGSTDDATREVLNTLHNKGLHVIHQPNGGLSAARMTGVRATSADTIVALDADDMLAPGSLAALQAAFSADPGLSVAYGDTELFGALTGVNRCPWAWDAWAATYVNMMTGAGSMIRREHLLTDDGWVLRHGYEDWDLWLSMHEARRRGAYVPRTILRYRQGTGRMLSNSRTMHAEIFATIVERHQELFAQRETLRANSIAPRYLTRLFPLIDAADQLDIATRHRLQLAATKPTRAFTVRLQRLGRKLRHTT